MINNKQYSSGIKDLQDIFVTQLPPCICNYAYNLTENKVRV